MHRLRTQIPTPLMRLIVRGGFLVLRVYWVIARPRTRGVKCVVRHDGKVVVVRHTYGNRMWDLPGGRANRAETLRAAAARELHEELGLTLRAMRPLHAIEARPWGKRDRVAFFVADVDRDTLVLEEAEIAEARWVAPDALPPGTSRLARAVIARSLWPRNDEAEETDEA